MKIGMVLFFFALCIAGALVAHYALTPAPSHFAMGMDRSLSVERDCSGLITEGERLMTEVGTQEGSTVTLLALGSSSLNPEPERLFDQPVPILSDAIFGKDEDGFEKKQQAFLSGLQKSCEVANGSKDSPVLRLVVRGIAHLRSRGCGPGGRCAYAIQSDLEEDSDSVLRAVIQHAVKNSTAALPAELAGSVDNAGIRVEFCGTSEVRTRRSGRHASPETLTRLWLGLFTHPELVSFQPYCGREQ